MKNNDIIFNEDEHGLVFGSRERAEAIRKDLNLDEFDQNDDTMSFIFPKDAYCISRSFMLGMIGNSIYRLGDEKFREKYKFVFDDIHMETLESCIQIVMNKY